jgi:YfiR/HmsC-like
MAFLTGCRWLPLLLGCALGGSATAWAQHGEGDLKAAFVYNFAKFVEWTAPLETQNASANFFYLCLVGSEDSLLAALPRLEGKQVQGREIRVRSVQPRAEAIKGCHILAIGDSEAGRATELARLATAQGALSVSAIEQFIEWGGAIGLVTVDNRIQFEINLETTQKANLKLAAQFVKLARKVKK